MYTNRAEIIAARLGFTPMPEEELNTLIAQAIDAQPEAWLRFSNGDERASAPIIGHVMMMSEGRADGKLTIQILNEKLTTSQTRYRLRL